MIAVLLGCFPPGPVSDGPTYPVPPPDSGEPPVERPTLRSPPAPEDLDPDPAVLHVALAAAPATFEVAGEVVEGFAYNGQVPGPTLRLRVGDRLIVDLRNDLDLDTSIHWHGVAAPWAMDGAEWMLDPVAPGASFTYDFTVDRAGTFWYHPHFDTEQEVDLGLYGALVVEDPEDPVPDEDLVVVLDAWGESAEHDYPEGTHLTWTANGLADPVWRPTGGTARLRVLDVSNTGYVDLTWPGLRRIAGDQGLLSALDLPASVLLGPGDRADFEVLAGEPFEVATNAHSLHGGATPWAEPTRLFDVEPASASPAASLAWPFTGGSPSADPSTTDIVYVFQGSDETGVWKINGETYPDVTVESAAIGTPIVLEVRNLSDTEHPFHLHGHSFEVLSVQGVAVSAQAIEDTVNVPVQGWLRLRLVPTNPGQWMAHCHIPSHSDGGMMTVVDIE